MCLSRRSPRARESRRLAEIPGVDYLSGDITSPHAMVHLDITDLQLEDDSFDVVMCSHVLEHVDDSDKAMRERVFGQRDHVRLFGRNYPRLLTRGGHGPRLAVPQAPCVKPQPRRSRRLQ